MKKLYSGKTKDVFLKGDGNILLYFKDSVTGTEGAVDPGGDQVIGEIVGKGVVALKTTVYFFNLLRQWGIETHFIGLGSDFGHKANTLVVKRAKTFNVEVICREKAWGSFVRRYGKFVKHGAILPSIVEFTIKDDERGDPLITEDALVALGLVSKKSIQSMKQNVWDATEIIKGHLKAKDLELIDIKYEFGEVDGKTVLIDEISGDSMRVLKDDRVLSQTQLYMEIFS